MTSRIVLRTNADVVRSARRQLPGGGKAEWVQPEIRAITPRDPREPPGVHGHSDRARPSPLSHPPARPLKISKPPGASTVTDDPSHAIAADADVRRTAGNLLP